MRRFSGLAVFVLALGAGVGEAQQKLDLQTVIDALEKDGRFVFEGRGGTVLALSYDYTVDGEKVEAIAFRPAAEGKYPGVLLIPGYSRTARDYIPMGLRLAREGFACVAVTQRGFGKSAGKPDFVGPRTIAALEAGFRRFRGEPYVDAERMGVFGYSRGAMAAALLAPRLTNEELRAGVFAAGIYDFKKAHQDIKLAGIRENMEKEAGLTDAAVKDRNAITRMKDLPCPVLILHGEKDENAPVNQAYLLRDTLKELRKEHELKIFPDRDHDLGRQNLNDATLEFLNRRLKENLRVQEDDRAITIETDKLQAVIPKKNPKQWMTGIEKGSFLDKTTGFREVGDGLMVVDWLMEAGSDGAWAEKVIAKDGHGVGRYTWHENETDPARKEYARMAHGISHRKRMVEGPQLCHRMKPVQPEVIRGQDFVAVKTTYKFEYAAPGRKPGSTWTQLIVFPEGERFFLLMDRIDSVNESEEMFLRNDTPGCVRHEKGDTFSEMYLSYLSGPKGLRIPAQEFFEPFPPDLKYGYRRDTHRTPAHFIRAYHLRDKKTGQDGPWLAGLTLEPSVVYEAWCSMRPGGIIVMIEEIHGKKVKAGDSFSAAHIVGYFDTIEEMHRVYDKYKGHTALAADAKGWRLGK